MCSYLQPILIVPYFVINLCIQRKKAKSIGYSRSYELPWGADLQEQTAVNLLYMKTPLSCTDITLSGTKSLQLSKGH